MLAVVVAVAALARRRLPLVFAAAAFADSLVRPTPSPALPMSGYGLGRYQPASSLRWSALAAAVLTGMRPWQFTSISHAASNIAGAGFLVLLPAAVGAWVRTRAELLATLLERAERAEREQELRAREAVLTERGRMVLQAGAIEMAAADPVRVGQLAGQLGDVGRRALEELRQVVGLLHAEEDSADVPLAPQPTLADLDDLVAGARDAGVTISLSQRGQPRRLDSTVERTAYRVVQEAVTNAGKHAPGAAISISLDYGAAELDVCSSTCMATPPASPQSSLHRHWTRSCAPWACPPPRFPRASTRRHASTAA